MNSARSCRISVPWYDILPIKEIEKLVELNFHPNVLNLNAVFAASRNLFHAGPYFLQVFEITAARLRTVGSGIHFNKQTSDDCQGHRIKTIVG